MAGCDWPWQDKGNSESNSRTVQSEHPSNVSVQDQSDLGNAPNSDTAGTGIYENKRLGFTLQIASSWEGYWDIVEYEDCVSFNFVGRSNTAKEYAPTVFFFLGNEKCVEEAPFIDGVKQIGFSGGSKIYYYTTTDYPVGAFDDVAGRPDTDPDEKKLCGSDFEKARAMEKDIPGILESFKAMKP